MTKDELKELLGIMTEIEQRNSTSFPHLRKWTELFLNRDDYVAPVDASVIDAILNRDEVVG